MPLRVHEYLDLLDEWIPLEVFKHGAKTGFTRGTLSEWEVAEEESIPTPDIESVDIELVPGYHVFIEWISPGEPFADYGDSGSFVFAKRNGKIVPIGLHYSSKEGVSRAWLLWSWGNEIQESLNSDLIFCTRANCDYAAP